MIALEPLVERLSTLTVILLTQDGMLSKSKTTFDEDPFQLKAFAVASVSGCESFAGVTAASAILAIGSVPVVSLLASMSLASFALVTFASAIFAVVTSLSATTTVGAAVVLSLAGVTVSPLTQL
jgi:hypothetical protein